MAVLEMNVLSEEITKVARKAVKLYGVSYEDHVQDLWLWMIEKQPEHLGTARAQLVNRSIDLCRKHARVYGGWKQVDFDDPCGQNYANEESSDESEYRNSAKTFEDMFDYVEIEDMFNSLPEGKARVFAVCKAYLNEGFEFLKKEFYSIFNSLPEEDREIIETSSKYTDDLILKHVLHIKTGTNSGTARVIKQTLYKWVAAV